ncbi:hypothetical protein FVR03_16725 [Pontibacter qinzhouensis]|uniref:Uncharacterized protein n=1 Tax=Pontibacter qinzhouensis TaxID=2603253 RepID=A0A5C8JIF6_9BACT|nr:hypothetical protein [Pontibacter qinzhouensis]TXK36786.1 hypothetical protein FVR03_16725 [Pontibacter qinzhouensis]
MFLSLFQCNKNRVVEQKLEHTYSNIEALTDSIHYYENALGWEVGEKKLYTRDLEEFKALAAIHTPNQKKLATQLQNVKEKDLKAAVQVQEKVQVTNLTSTKKDSATYGYEDPNISFQVTVQDTTVTLDTLTLLNDKTVILKDTKKGTVVSVVNSNPYFKTADIDGILVPEKKRFYNSKAFKAGLFLAGCALGVHLSR